MKYKAKQYAEALATLMAEKKPAEQEAKLAKSFFKFLEKNGDIKKAKEIFTLAESLFIKKTGRRKFSVETARKLKPKQQDLINTLAHQGDIIDEKINPELIAGIKIIINDNQLDLSMQKKLQKIFK